MIRMSVTEIDGYRWWKNSEEDMDVLLARLRKQEPPTEAMMAGRAFHKVLENASPEFLSVAEAEGFKFTFDLDAEMWLPPVKELKGEVLLCTPSGPVTLVGIVDGLIGYTVRDYKLTGRFDAEKYADSYQWRCYLMMFGGKKFDYDVFVGKEKAPKEWRVYEYHNMELYAYPEMESDVRREVSELAEVIRRHVPERVTEEAA